jgi:hypothetical protein
MHTEHFQNIATWLTTLKNPGGLTRLELRKLRRAALRFRVVDGFLWAKSSPGKPLRRVIDDLKEQAKIIS